MKTTKINVHIFDYPFFCYSLCVFFNHVSEQGRSWHFILIIIVSNSFMLVQINYTYFWSISLFLLIFLDHILLLFFVSQSFEPKLDYVHPMRHSGYVFESHQFTIIQISEDHNQSVINACWKWFEPKLIQNPSREPWEIDGGLQYGCIVCWWDILLNSKQSR